MGSTNSPLLQNIEEFFSIRNSEDCRLNIAGSFQTNGTAHGILIDDSQDFSSTLDKELTGLKFCISSNEEIVRMFAIDFDIHTYFLEK